MQGNVLSKLLAIAGMLVAVALIVLVIVQSERIDSGPVDVVTWTELTDTHELGLCRDGTVIWREKERRVPILPIRPRPVPPKPDGEIGDPAGNIGSVS